MSSFTQGLMKIYYHFTVYFNSIYSGTMQKENDGGVDCKTPKAPDLAPIDIFCSKETPYQSQTEASEHVDQSHCKLGAAQQNKKIQSCSICKLLVGFSLLLILFHSVFFPRYYFPPTCLINLLQYISVYTNTKISSQIQRKSLTNVC